jgi:hypothetical protein
LELRIGTAWKATSTIGVIETSQYLSFKEHFHNYLSTRQQEKRGWKITGAHLHRVVVALRRRLLGIDLAGKRIKSNQNHDN